MSTDEPGHELIGKLERATGTKAPEPLAHLGEKTERFSECTDPQNMRGVVAAFLD